MTVFLNFRAVSEKMKSKNLICTSIDDKYLWPWMVMVYSAALNSEDKNFRIVIANLNGMLSKESTIIAQKFVKSLGLSLEIINIETSLNPAFDHHFNLTVYSRLFLMDKLEEDFTWFDADLLLMPGWDQIFLGFGSQGKKKKVISGVLDSKITRQRLLKNRNQAFERTAGNYVNTGVIKICTKEWKQLYKVVYWQEMALNLEKYGLSLPDQDVLNYLCADHIRLLPAGFNYIVGDEISFREPIFIKHYAGWPKPWRLDKKGKEFLLAVQGAKYFAPKHWITQSSDAFLHYPQYWQVEDQLLAYLQDLEYGQYLPVIELRNRNLNKFNGASNLKHYLIQLISRRFF